MLRLSALWISLRSSLWFIPSIIVVGSMLAADGLVEAGARIPALSQAQLPRIFGFGAEGSRAMLSAIATSMITIAGVAFSITIVALSLASSQYSPRVLRQFMRDRANQVVLGIFVGVFAFCLTLLPRIRGGDAHAFVPALAVACGVVYALVGVGCLIFFIHHVATSIQVSCIVADIAAETRRAADHVFPAEPASSNPTRSPLPDSDWHPVLAPASGYIQLIDERALLRAAVKHDLVIRSELPIGEFVVASAPLLVVAGTNAADPEALRDLKSAITLSRAQTVEQDVLFGMRQIVDVALRALSPSLNDPTTGALCIEYLTTILQPLVSRPLGDAVHCVEKHPRVHVRRPDFAALLDHTFGEIRVHAGSELLVYEALLRGLSLLAEAAVDPARRAVLAQEASEVRASIIAHLPLPRSTVLRTRAQALVIALNVPGATALVSSA